MQTREWRTVDKSQWGDGLWTQEPDKVQYQDPDTGLPILIVRGPLGSLCGYVGVGRDHPAYGLNYDGLRQEDADAKQEAFRTNMKAWSEAGCPPFTEWYASDKPGQDIDYAVVFDLGHISVHGGLTFSGPCAEISQEGWHALRAKFPRWREEAKRFPIGDSARYLAKWASAEDRYDNYEEIMQATAICHLPEPGEPDDIHWFGFDCSHAGDEAPGLSQRYREAVGDQYRDIEYVKAECRSLAQQLMALRRALPKPESDDAAI